MELAGLDLIAQTVIATLWSSVAVTMGWAAVQARGIATRTYRILITISALGWAIYYLYRMFTGEHADVWASRLLQGLLIAGFWYHLWLIRMGGDRHVG